MAEREALDWRRLLAVYALICVAFAARAFYNAETVPLLADTDDAMRLVVVRDLLAGQGWYDNVQHRMNTPFGAEIHWSRLADLPLAALLLLLRPMLGAGADVVAAFVLPLLWLFALLYLTARITLRLAGGDGLLAALVLPAFALGVTGEFAPGRLDHHSLQILLLLVMTWLSIEALSRPRFAIWAGIAAATAIALGIEALPSVAAAILAFGLMWVADPARAGTMRAFGISFAAATLVHLAIALPPQRWLVPACDAISVTYAVAAVGVGIAFTGLTLLPLVGRSPWGRIAAGIGAGGTVLAALVLTFPLCLGGPYAALDPWLRENWIGRITEAVPLWEFFRTDPVYPLAVAVPSFVALGATGFRVLRGAQEGRDAWLVYTVFLALAVATMLIQIRASRMATPLAVPAAAWLIALARGRYLERKSLSRAGLLIASWVASAGVAVGLIATPAVNGLPQDATELIADTRRSDQQQCLMPEAFRLLAVMPPERVMTPIDLGAHMLAFTPHEVVAAPYHRNEAGVRDAFDFFHDPIEEARAILDRRGISLVVTCPSLPELAERPDTAVDSFVALHRAEALPGWLAEIGPEGTPLRVFGVLPR
jgi:hypothetical protein